MNDISEILNQFDFTEINNETKRTWFANTNIYSSSYSFTKECYDEQWQLSIETKKNENCVFIFEIFGTTTFDKENLKHKSIASQNNFSFRRKKTIDHYKVIGFENFSNNEELLILLEYFIDYFINISQENQNISFHLIKNKEESDNKIDSTLISNLIKLIDLFKS
jgi:hypothetical protein